MSSCLIIVDVQNGFISPLTNYVPGRIDELLRNKHFDHIVATRFENTSDGPYVRFMNWNGLFTEKERALHTVVLRYAEKVFRKTTYSCFTAEFDSFVTDCGIDSLYIAGIDTDCCVLASAIDAFDRNLACKVILPCCASNGGQSSHEAAALVMKRCIGEGEIVTDITKIID